MNLKVHNVKGTGEREGHKKRERVKEWLFILPGRFISSVLPAHTLSLSVLCDVLDIFKALQKLSFNNSLLFYLIAVTCVSL